MQQLREFALRLKADDERLLHTGTASRVDLSRSSLAPAASGGQAKLAGSSVTITETLVFVPREVRNEHS